MNSRQEAGSNALPAAASAATAEDLERILRCLRGAGFLLVYTGKERDLEGMARTAAELLALHSRVGPEQVDGVHQALRSMTWRTVPEVHVPIDPDDSTIPTALRRNPPRAFDGATGV